MISAKKIDFLAPDIAEQLTKYSVTLSVEEGRDLQQKLRRPMTLTEAVIFSIQLSEHCSYKSSRSFLKTLPTTGKNVFLGPSEDAGGLTVFEHNGEKYVLIIGHESHNSPSQIVPYEGAATGVGGIVRDILCMGARPVGVLDSLRFGNPRKNTPKHIASGVVEGIAGYANPLGVPNLGGDVYFDDDFNENCLVNVTALGAVRESELIHSYVPKCAGGEAWDLLIVGKPTDNSGFGGASFASKSFSDDDDAEAQKGAIQEPNPFLERHLVASILDLLERLKKTDDFSRIAIKDLGAGGVVCATVEICDAAEFGAEIFLDQLHTIGDFPPHVLACAETQERFCIACYPDLTSRIIQHFREAWALGEIAENAGVSRVGKVRSDGQYLLHYDSKVLCNMPARLVTAGVIYDRPYVEKKYNPKSVSVTYENNTFSVS